MARPHAASIVEDAWHRRVDSVLRSRGWQTRIVTHTGYGSEEFVRVLGRVLLTRRPEPGERADAGASSAELRSAEDERRGWRAFITAPTMNVPVTITVGDKTVHTRTDRSGYIDTKVRITSTGQVRIAWTDPATKTTLFSRSVGVKIGR